LHESKQHDLAAKDDPNMSAQESERIKTTFDQTIYALDTYKSILSKIGGLDYRYPGRVKNPDGTLNHAEANDFDEEHGDKAKSSSRSSGITEESRATGTGADGKAALESESKDEDDKLNIHQLRHIEGLLSKKCKKCMTIKAPQSHHCSICKRCVARMDHHCPWVNNCVGVYNQKHFLLFLLYVCLGSSHALFLIGYKCGTCLEANCAMFADFSVVIIAGLSLFLALLFDLFVMVMFCDQISCIVENTSTIDKLQKKRAQKQGKQTESQQMHQPRTWWQNICEVFTGSIHGGFSWRWLLPVDVDYNMEIEMEFK